MTRERYEEGVEVSFVRGRAHYKCSCGLSFDSYWAFHMHADMCEDCQRDRATYVKFKRRSGGAAA